MRPTIVLALMFLAAADAAPKLSPQAEFVSHKGAGENAFVKFEGQDVASVHMAVDFQVSGPAGATYTVELYVEANSTGEKAKLIDRRQVTLSGQKGKGAGEAKANFDRYTQDRLAFRKNVGVDHLPSPLPGQGWSYRLVLQREGDDPVADTGIHWAPYEWSPKPK
jgi:hypothetical protein